MGVTNRGLVGKGNVLSVGQPQKAVQKPEKSIAGRKGEGIEARDP